MKALAQSNAVRFENRKWAVRLHDNPFAGPPRPELDAAWHELFERAGFPCLPCNKVIVLLKRSGQTLGFGLRAKI